MFKNYLITTFRNLWRNKVNTIINIIGLAISIACCIVVYVFIKHEKTFDNFHAKASRIYRVVVDEKNSQGVAYEGYLNFAAANALRNDFPDLETVTQVYVRNRGIVSINEAGDNRKLFEENEISFADEHFLKTFDFPALAKKSNDLLSAPDEVVLTKELADKFFGKEYEAKYGELIGRSITINKKNYRVSAILKDVPRNSNIPFGMLLSFKEYFKNNPNLISNWKEAYSDSYTFVTLPEGYSPKKLEAALITFTKKYLDIETARRQTYHLQPLSGVHTDEKYGGTLYATPSILIVAFIVMGIIVLLTASINFINLATAQSLKRAKEVGIRKTLGGNKFQLMIQFMSETFLLIVIASGFGLLLAREFLTSFNEYLSFVVDLGLHIDTTIIYFLTGLIFLITFLAGYYPARATAGYPAIKALKYAITAKNTGFTGTFSIRKVLIVTQFAVSQLLIIGTVIVAAQMQYFYNRDLGYKKEGILTVEIPENDPKKLEVFRNQLQGLTAVKEVTFSSGPPTSASNSFGVFRLKGSSQTEKFDMERKFVDPHYLPTYDIKLIAGRNLHESDIVTLNDSANRYNVVMNKKAISLLGLTDPEKAIGLPIVVNDKDEATIVGVTDDFYNSSLQQHMSPVLLFYSRNWVAMASIKMNTGNATNTVSFIRKSWEALYPDNIFKSMTLNEYIRNRAFYLLEDVMYKGFKIFVVLSLLIGCMGLYGLVSFLAIQRQKEIGIRKVLGASVQVIVYMFSKEFALLVLIAFFIAAPIGFLAMRSWLDTFANRINMHASHFAIAFILSLSVAAITISFQAIKAAIANPVKSLRTE